MDLSARQFYWPKMLASIKKWIDKCGTCNVQGQRHKKAPLAGHLTLTLGNTTILAINDERAAAAARDERVSSAVRSSSPAFTAAATLPPCQRSKYHSKPFIDSR